MPHLARLAEPGRRTTVMAVHRARLDPDTDHLVGRHGSIAGACAIFMKRFVKGVVIVCLTWY
jgi:hypothetical protein